MRYFLGKLFNIQSSEWPRFLLLYLMLFVPLTGVTWGEAIVEAAFLRQVGVQFLPLAIMGSALGSIVAMTIYAAFADRVANDKLLIVIMCISIVGMAAGLIFLEWGLVAITYPMLYLIANIAFRDILNVHWPTFVNDFYDTRAAKRIVPVLSSGIRVAGIFAGLTMPILNRWLTPGSIILLWIGSLAVMVLLVWLAPRLLGDARPSTTNQPRASFDLPSATSNIQEGYRYVFQSSFLRWLALSTLLVMVLLAFVNYQTGKVMLAELESIEAISNFTGLLNGVSNLIALPFQLFVLSRIAEWAGLGNANLIFPLTTLATCGGLLATPGLASAGLGHLNRSTFRTTIRNPIDSLLYNAVPMRVKARARAFIGGVVTPLGTFIGGAILLWLQNPRAIFSELVPVMIGGLAIAYIGSAWMVRRQYTRALVTMLEQEDYTFLLSQRASDLSVTDSATLDWLRGKLEQPDASPELVIFTAQLIGQVGGEQAVSILSHTARSAADARVRSAILDTLAASDTRSDAARQLYSDLLADPDSRVRQSAMAGLESIAEPKDKRFITRMLEMIHDPDVTTSVWALSALARSGNLYQLTPAVQALDQLLSSQEPQRRALGVRVLGQAGSHRAIRQLAGFLTDPADQVRLEAVTAIETASLTSLPQLKTAGSRIDNLVTEKVVSLLHDPIERVRQMALVILGRVAAGDQETCQAMVGALTDPSPQVRATAVDVLAQAGKSIVPVIRPQIESPNPQLRKMAAVILSRVNPQEFGALAVGPNITDNLVSIYRRVGLVEALSTCHATRGMLVLQSALREQNQQLVSEVFYLLTAMHDPAAVNIIRDSLNSPVARVRANALEALESLTTPQLAGLIAPLLEPGLPPGKLLSLGKAAWAIEQDGAAQAIHELAHSTDPWLRAITFYALGEMGASMPKHAPVPAGQIEDKQEGRRARRTRADLFDALGETQKPGDEKTNKQPTPPPESTQGVLALADIEAILKAALADPVEETRRAAHTASQMINPESAQFSQKEAPVLSAIEKIIFLKNVPFFCGMTVEQLKVLANVCEEEFFPADARLFSQGDPGGILYVVVNGKVGIEQEKRSGSFARLATIEAHSYFGEMNLFDNSQRTVSAIAIQDTLTLKLRREPLIALARQYPDLSLELINVLSQRLREASDRIAELTRTRPRELHKLFDQLE